MSSQNMQKWRVEGYDTFEGGPDGFYPLEGEHDSEADAVKTAKDYLAELERTQPAASSGGQGDLGIQDHVYVVSPTGDKRRIR